MDTPSALDRDKFMAGLVRVAPSFVGRRQELDWLLYTLQEVMAGQPHVVLMPGEAGIGKTRLLQELRSQAMGRGVQVGYGRGYEDLTLPYLPLVEALHSLLEQVPQDIQNGLEADLERVRWLLERGGEPIDADRPAISAEADQHKLKLFLAASHVMIALAQHRPTLFIVDDLHWADGSSIDLFGHLAFTVADTADRERVPLYLIATYRPVEAETRLARLIARLQRERICQTFTLPGLNESEIDELIRAMGLARPSHQLTATLSAVTRGNPLCIQEGLQYLVRQGALQRRGGYLVATTSAADLRLPAQVTAVIAAGMQGLSESCWRLLTLASFLGERFTLQTLSAVSDVSEDEALSVLEEGLGQRLLLSEGQAFQFAHPLIRQVLYQELSATRRQRLHWQVARTLERLYADNREAHVMEIAHHLIRAGRVATIGEVVQYARQAGDQASRLFAWGEAARYYEAALSAAESIADLLPHDRAELHHRAGFAYHRDTDVGPCLDHYEKAIAAYRLTDDLHGLARVLTERARVYFTLAAVPYGTLVDIQPLEEVLAALGESAPELRCRIMAIMSGVYWHGKQTAKATDMAQRALAIGERLQDDQLCAYACFALGVAHAQGLQVRQALTAYQRGLVYARRTDDPWLLGGPLQRMALLLILHGRLAEAEAVALEACEPTQQAQDWGHHSVALSALASVAVAKGDFAAVERYAYEAMLMVSRSHYPWGGARALLALTCARALRGAWAEAADALDLLAEPGRVFNDIGPIIQATVRVFRHLLRALSGAGAEVTEAETADLVRAMALDHFAVAPFCALIELSDLRAAAALAEAPYRALSQAAEWGVRFSNGWLLLIPRVLGVAATLQRRWDAAETHFQEAIEVASGAGARPELGRTYLDYTRMLVARGVRSDRRRAIALLSHATPIFRELGMEPFVQQAARLAADLQTKVPAMRRPRVLYPNRLSAREVDVLRQLTAGHTNQEIADNLMLSAATITRHVASLFTKLSIESRAAAVAYALEQGFVPHVPRRRRAMAIAADDRDAGEGTAPQPVVSSPSTQALHIILITDMEGSTALIQRWGDVQAHELLRLHNGILRDCLRRHHGIEITHTGDGIEASFPAVSSAVACAMAIQRAFAKYNREHPNRVMRVRIGIHAGEPIRTEGRLFGTAVHTAFRICARARSGQILVSDVIRQLAAGKGFDFMPHGRVAFKGLSKRMPLFEVPWNGARAR